MFSKEFMAYLGTYSEEETTTKKEETTREIEFRDNTFKKLAYVTVSVKR